MYYSAIPLARLVQESILGWSVYAAGAVAVVLVVAVTVAVCERRERRRLERDLAVARQAPPLPREWTSQPPDAGGGFRFWLFPLIAVCLGLVVTAWSVWNVLR